MRLLILRHASTPWNEGRRLQGRRDLALSRRGIAEASAWRLPGCAAAWPVLTSPLKRAQQTAELMGLQARPAPWSIEMDWGRWEGRSLAELRVALGARMTAIEARGLDLTPPGGESPRAVSQRLAMALEAYGRGYGGWVLVAHKGVIRALLSLATGWDMRLDWPERLRPACGHLFELGPMGRPALVRLNLDLR
ncbi:MAG: histidine phosphatase family protein [Rhodospirillales bacterium]|nr:histidine phosphatase family protein [Rhodospirillales bacterium]